MKSQHILNFIFGIYIFIFLTYLFGPLIIMSATSFNSADFLQLLHGNVLVGDGF